MSTLANPNEILEDSVILKLHDENYQFSATSDEVLKGQKLYTIHCLACHRPDGKGSPGFIPPLVESEWVTGDKSRLIDVVLRGLNVPISVNGVSYSGEMPSYKNLEDDQIADILNFVRVHFGKVNGNIIAADVFHQRKGLSK